MARSLFFTIIAAYVLPTILAHCECGYRTDTGAILQFALLTDFTTMTTAQFQQSPDWAITSRLFPASPTHAYDLLYVPANVAVADNKLRLTCSACTSNCTSIASAEIQTKRTDILYGSFRAKFNVRGGPGAVGAFFWYASDVNEIDIELLTRDNPSVVHFTNQPNWSTSMDMPNGVVQKVENQYRIDWNSNQTDFYVNANYMHSETNGVPSIPGSMYMNMWGNGGSFSGLKPPASDVILSVSKIELYFNTSDTALSASWATNCAAKNVAVCNVVGDIQNSQDRQNRGNQIKRN